MMELSSKEPNDNSTDLFSGRVKITKRDRNSIHFEQTRCIEIPLSWVGGQYKNNLATFSLTIAQR